MKRLMILTTVLLLTFMCEAQTSIYTIPVKNMQGETETLAAFKGKVLLIVNTATRCGFTPQYEAMEKLYSKYRELGFEVLDFPCNQFGAQAPEDILKIRQFCTENYETTFPLFDKVDVNGPAAAPLFTFLKEKQGFRGFDLNNPRGKRMDSMLRKWDANYDKKPDIKWNFTKFLVDAEGNVVRRFEPTESMDDVENAVKDLLVVTNAPCCEP